MFSLTVVSFLLVGLGVGTTPASAATNGRYSIFPVTISGSNPREWFNYLVNPGTVIKDAVTVTNQTTESIAFKLFPADADFTLQLAQFCLLRTLQQPATLAFKLCHHRF